MPAGGIYSGALEIKTADEVATAGQAYGPCYHLACDDYANLSDKVLDINADAVAFATLMHAMGIS